MSDADYCLGAVGAATYYHLHGRLGCTCELLDSNRATADSRWYYAFGEVRTSSGSTTNPFKFVGQLGYYDEPSTEFKYLRAKYCPAQFGRLPSVDPAAAWTEAYRCAFDNPVRYTDPTGLGKTLCYLKCWVLYITCVIGGGRGREVAYTICKKDCDKYYTVPKLNCWLQCPKNPSAQDVQRCQDCCSRERDKCKKTHWAPVCQEAWKEWFYGATCGKQGMP
jgi:RHS repeat-associated protein